MPLVVKDRVKETTTTTGTGTITLAGAVAGFQSFSVVGNGNTTYYAIVGPTEWEVGIGTYTLSGTTLARNTILESSNGGTAVNFSAGSKEVFVTYPAERSVDIDTAQTLTNKTISGANNTITNVSLTTGVTGTLPIANGGTGATTNTAARTNLGATTLGSNLFTIANPGAITFPRFNADNTVSSLNATDFRTAIGAGTSSTTGTVTSVSGTGTASGLTLSGTVTTSGSLTLSGTVNSLAAGTYAISISGNAATVTNGVYTTGDQTIGGEKTFSSRLIASATGRSATVGGSPFAPSGGIATQSSYLEISAGTGGDTNSSGIVFHNPLVSTAALEYVNTGANDGYFNFKSDDTTWNVRVNGTQVVTNSGTWDINISGNAATATTATNVSGTVAIANGGTGATTAGDALTNLGAYPASNPNGYTSNTGTVTSVGITPGTGISVSGSPITTSGSITVTNDAPMVYPGAGIAVSTGTAWGTSKTSPTGDIVGTTDTQTLTNKTLTDPAIIGTIIEDVFTITDGASVDINPADGSIQSWTLGANRTPTANNWLSGESVTLMIDDGTARTITWTTIGVVWVGGTAPTLATTGWTVIQLWKRSTTVYGTLVGSVA